MSSSLRWEIWLRWDDFHCRGGVFGDFSRAPGNTSRVFLVSFFLSFVAIFTLKNILILAAQELGKEVADYTGIWAEKRAGSFSGGKEERVLIAHSPSV